MAIWWIRLVFYIDKQLMFILMITMISDEDIGRCLERCERALWKKENDNFEIYKIGIIIILAAIIMLEILIWY